MYSNYGHRPEVLPGFVAIFGHQAPAPWNGVTLSTCLEPLWQNRWVLAIRDGLRIEHLH